MMLMLRKDASRGQRMKRLRLRPSKRDIELGTLRLLGICWDCQAVVGACWLLEVATVKVQCSSLVWQLLVCAFLSLAGRFDSNLALPTWRAWLSHVSPHTVGRVWGVPETRDDLY